MLPISCVSGKSEKQLSALPEMIHTVSQQPGGSVTIAPQVLTTVISRTIHAVPGFAQAGHIPHFIAGRLPGGMTRDQGVLVQVTNGHVRVHCYLVARPDTNLLELGMAVQATVAAAIRELVGMVVDEVNVYIQDVEVERG